ncbi:MAG: NFACT family protein [Candidatus Micrarchaeota archaeon]
MHRMTNFEYSFLVDELSILTGKHFDRIRKLDDGIYRIKISNHEILCELGTRIHFTNYIEKSEQTDKFTEKVAKELDNAKLKEIKQINKDRIVMFDFDKGQLIFEMFGEGNAILVNNNITVTAVRYESWSGREIKPGLPYLPPKNIPSEKLELSERYVIVSLMKLPMGKDYVIEALTRAKINEKTSGISLTTNEKTNLEKELKKIYAETSPIVFYDDEKVVDFGLINLSKYQTSSNKKFKTLSEAADEYYSKVEKSNPKLEKLISRLEKQQERLEDLIQEEKNFKENGDLVYAKYQSIETLINLAKEGKFEELEIRYKAKIDKKEKSLEVDL